MENSTSSFENFDNKEMPKNSMALAIIGTILGLCPTICCINFITGLIAIYFASQVKKKFESGDYISAEKAAKNAKILSYITLGLFVLGIIISIVTYDPAQQEEMREKIMEIMNQ
ncbi:CD225/dispanin family protein [Pseudofulvibacter geojedonensis]|uniref:CD225/dispanin family protein n=1 Tax=Pseudofulvibacter geojedonensis TaxID=1123758 RepID=A0ABW3I5L4_9FLAO